MQSALGLFRLNFVINMDDMKAMMVDDNDLHDKEIYQYIN